MGDSHVHPRFLNDLLNSSYVAELSDPDSGLEAQHLGALIVQAHKSQQEIIDAAVDAACTFDPNEDIVTTLDRTDKLPNAKASFDRRFAKIEAHVDVVTTARSYEDTELELLKIAVISPDLYNNLRSVFVDHKYPNKLDEVGQQLRRFFLSKGDSDGESQENKTCVAGRVA